MKKIFFFAVFFVAIGLLLTTADAAKITLALNPNSTTEPAGYKLYYGVESRDIASYPVWIDLGWYPRDVQHDITLPLECGKIYHFAATAYDSSGNESSFSTEVDKATPACVPPVIVEDGDDPSAWTKVSGSGTKTTVFDPTANGGAGSDVLVFSSTGATALTTFKLLLSSIYEDNVLIRLRYAQATNSFIIVNASTTSGARNMYYQPIDTNGLGTSTNVKFGIGSSVKDGAWHTVERDMQADITLAQPGNYIDKENYIMLYVYGLGAALIIDEVQFSSE